MKTMLCSRDGGCCPSIEKDVKTGITYITDGDQKIGFTTKQLKELYKYLHDDKPENTNCACKCKSCQVEKDTYFGQ